MLFFKVHHVVCLLLATMSAMANNNDNIKSVVAGNNGLTGELYSQLAKPGENLIYSPISVHCILSLLYAGAAGQTLSAFQKVLRLPDQTRTANGYAAIMSHLNSAQNVTLSIANRVYVKEGFALNDNFKAIATKQFFAGAQNIQFTEPTAAKTINDWVVKETKNKIKDLIKQTDLDSDTRMVLVNAIYFKGDWLDKFNKENTRTDKFYVTETKTVDCDMMFRMGKYNYKDDTELDAQVIEMPYKNMAISMIIVLPRTKGGIADLEKKLTKYDMNKLSSGMQKVEVELSLPKFKIESELNMNEPLQKLGLDVAFSPKADFSGLMKQNETLYISKVIQKAFIEVNEEGAEAAAATGAIMMMRCMPMPVMKIAFTADHPFVYYIAYKEDGEIQPLFHGKMSNAQ